VTVAELKSRFFHLGLQVGAASQMFLASCVIMAFAYDDQSGAIFELSAVYYPLFRALFFITFFSCLYGINLFLWKRMDVDYRAVLGVTHAHNYHVLFRLSFLLMTFVFSCFAMYVLSLRSPLVMPNKHIFPALAISGVIGLLLWPFDVTEFDDRSQRMSLLRQLGRVLLSPLFSSSFGATFLADVLTSMPKVFCDLLFVVCSYTSGHALRARWSASSGTMVHFHEADCSDRNHSYFVWRISLSLLPFWIRLMQCLRAYRDSSERRHLLNALKYCTSISTVSLSFVSDQSETLWRAWLTCATLSTSAALAWDLFMDWGWHERKLQMSSGGAGFVRAPATPTDSSGQWHLRRVARSGGVGGELSPVRRGGSNSSMGSSQDPADAGPMRSYPSWAFCTATVTNVIARLGWAVYISPGQKVVQQHVILLLGCVELLRRAQWAAFRIEWQHFNILKKKHEEAAAEQARAEQLVRDYAMDRHRRPVLGF